MNVVFLLEEESMRVCLGYLLEKALRDVPDVNCQFVTFRGKGDLEKRLPIKLKGWSTPNTVFVVVRDQDEDDCVKVKEHLLKLASGSGRDVLVRIVCHELEAWYFGDLEAVDAGFGTKLAPLARKKRYRNPDAIHHPKTELRKYLPELQQIDGARRIGPHLDPSRNTSHSLHVLIEGVRCLVRLGVEESSGKDSA